MGCPETSKLQGLRPSHPPSCLTEACAESPSPAEALILTLTCASLASGAVPPCVQPEEPTPLRDQDLLAQRACELCPTCRFSDPLHRSEEAREHACWALVQASSCCSSLLAGQRRADPPRPLSFYAVQSFPPLARLRACAPARGGNCVRSNLRAEAAPWWLYWEHTSAGIRPALLWARPV